MFNVFRRLHEWATRRPVARLEDPVLGELVLYDSSWECRVETRTGPFTLSVGGRYEPDERLLETARETVLSVDNFVDRVAEYLASESRQENWQPFADEMKQLTVSEVSYSWPRNPDAGMIFFQGPDDCKLWHCDVEGARFSGLVFDS